MNLYFLLILLPWVIYLCLKTKKSLHMLQQNWYDDDHRYLKWILKNPYKIFVGYDMYFVAFLIFLFLSVPFSFGFFALFYLVTFFFSLREQKKEQVKIPLNCTSRVKRLITTTTILYLIPIVTITFTFDASYFPYYAFLLGLLTYLNSFVVLTANVCNKPIEKQVFYYYKRKAVKKLKDYKYMEVIGITGSYGKTSSKNILSDVLNERFNAFPTPKNFNTPYGLIRTVNQYLDKFNDFFLAEMGAFKQGEIQELCDLVKPKYGILTKIGTAHLMTFGSQENIQKGKFELIESLPKDGVAVLNKDDELQTSYSLKNSCKVLWIGIEQKADVQAVNIKMTSLGTKFDCIFEGDSKKYPFETKLLGKANIYNILAAIALGKYLGMTIEELQRGVFKVKSVEHRLELKKMGNINIIDDAYNSNPIGSKMALDVLKLMPGKRIVVTPGMIELGSKEYELNKIFGNQISEVADEVILVGKEQTKAIYTGLLEKKYPVKNIHILNDVKEAFPMMLQLREKETYVLLENDLPDLFNEK